MSSPQLCLEDLKCLNVLVLRVDSAGVGLLYAVPSFSFPCLSFQSEEYPSGSHLWSGDCLLVTVLSAPHSGARGLFTAVFGSRWCCDARFTGGEGRAEGLANSCQQGWDVHRERCPNKDAEEC